MRAQSFVSLQKESAMKTILNTQYHVRAFAKTPLLILAVLAACLPASAWDFVQERNTIPVSFDGVECQVPWTTGYNYINPTFCDLDGDGDQDLVFGSDWGRASHYINIGTNTLFIFTLESDYLVELPHPPPTSQRTCRSAWGDLDNDGDFDLIFGAYDRMYYYLNSGDSISANFELAEEYFQGINFTTEHYPVLVDMDSDDDFDLFIGFGNVYTPIAGRMAFYQNIGTPENAVMDSVTNYFMEIDLGYECIPAYIDIDNDGDHDMFLGDEDGRIHYYRNDGTPEVYDFTFVTGEYAGVNVANIASPTFTDIDGDGDYDLFVGERSWGQDDRRGDINFYENIGTPDSAVFELVTQNFIGIDIGMHPSPALVDIDSDGLLDMFLGDSDGNINYFSNTGSEHDPYFTFVTETFESIAANYQSRPTFGDLDNDGDLDILAGRVTYNTGSLHLYRNDGTPEIPEYVLIDSNYLGITYAWPSPKLVDIDDDADLDLMVGHLWGQVVYWKNYGTPFSPNFIFEDSSLIGTPYEGEFCPVTFGDIDNDGDYNVIRGHPEDVSTPETDAKLDFYRNIGSPTNPEFILEEEHFAGITQVNFAEPYLADVDNDGDLDLFVGDSNGGVCLYRNHEVSVADPFRKNQPYTFTLHQNYPNPFNASTVISFESRVASKIDLSIYNIAGQKVFSLVTRISQLGTHEVVWNAEGMASGVYIVRLETAYETKSMPVMLVK